MNTLFARRCCGAKRLPSDQIPRDDSEREIGELFASAGDRIRGQVTLKYMRDPEISGAATARNEALRHSCSDVVLFLDDDVELEADFVETLLRAYAENPEVAGVSGIVTNYAPEPLLNRLWGRCSSPDPFMTIASLSTAGQQKLAAFGAAAGDAIWRWFDEFLLFGNSRCAV